jgi:hypothetical protein
MKGNMSLHKNMPNDHDTNSSWTAGSPPYLGPLVRFVLELVFGVIL